MLIHKAHMLTTQLHVRNVVMAPLGSIDNSEHHRCVHRLLDAVLRRPPDPHLVRVPLPHPRLRLRVRRDAGIVQQRY